ncbi:MAG: biotin/lipoyl-containing protein [bacterium]
MAEYIFTINGKDYKVNVKSIEKDIAEIELNGKDFNVNIKQLGVSTVKKKKRPARKQTVEKSTQTKPAGIKGVPAPLPGVILDVKVSVGDEVSEGQDILIMEAMKMENSIQSPYSGTVKSIKVKRDDSVQEGDILMEIGS